MIRRSESAPQLLSITEACERLGMSRYWGYQMVDKGTFPVPTVRLGSRIKVRSVDLDRFIAGE